MKCCVSTDVRTWTNWLTFEPDPDYSPDAGTGLLSRYRFSAATRNFTSGKSVVYAGLLAAAARCAFNVVLFTESVSRRWCGIVEFNVPLDTVSAPSAWNSLPIDIRDCSSEATFKKHLKTFLFHVAFN